MFAKIVLFGRGCRFSMARFCPLFSGSSGNSIYMGNAQEGILIDAGVSAKRMTEALEEKEIDIKTIRALFITHEHSDHIAGVRVFASKYQIPVYATRGTILAMERMGALNGRFPYYILEDGPTVVGDMQVTPFSTCHDSAQSCGYVVALPDDRRVAVVTDLGVFTEEIRNTVSGCDLIAIESNHDVDMLMQGSYPYILKKRILSPLGHLSNECCANELPGLVRQGATRFVLSHISRENNRPEVAYQASLNRLQEAGMERDMDFQLYVAKPKDFPHMILL